MKMARFCPGIALIALLNGCSEDASPSTTVSPADDTSSGAETTGVDTASGDDTTVVTGPTYYGGVKAILDAKCTNCHVDGGIKDNLPLTTYEEVKPLATLIEDRVSKRIMPPWPADSGCTEYLDDRSMTEEQLDTVVAWAKAGAPEGGKEDAAAPIPESGTGGLSRKDVSFKIPAPYTPTDRDDYRCFIFDWTEKSKTQYVTGFGVNPDEDRVVHHVIAYLVPPESIPALDDLDPDGDKNYECYGGSGVNSSAWLGGWAPGSFGSDFPAGTGIEVPPGSKVVVQIHYNTDNGGALPDQSSIDFKVDPTVEKTATIRKILNPLWVAGDAMAIPAGDADVVHAFEYKPPKKAAQGLKVWSAGLHMHMLGASASLRIRHADGTETCLLDIPEWDFHWQGSYRLKTPVTVVEGDTVLLECHFNNTKEHRTKVGYPELEPTETSWGENTADEMCLGLVYTTDP